jgi:ActR/RegA family two-component response regulator
MTNAQGSVTGKRVLVVEDDYFIAKALARSLRAGGADVLGPVATVADAMDLIDTEPLDGAVLDINLRDGDLVFPVADALTERAVPFIFASGYSSGAIPERYAGIVRCVKPVEADAFRALFSPAP